MMVFSERLPDWTAAWHRPLLPLGLQTMRRWQQTGDVCAALNACEGAAGVCFVPQEELPAGMAYEQFFCDDITAYVGRLAPVLRFPGEEEMRALAEGALRVLHGEARAETY